MGGTQREGEIVLFYIITVLIREMSTVLIVAVCIQDSISITKASRDEKTSIKRILNGLILPICPNMDYTLINGTTNPGNSFAEVSPT